MAQNRMDFGLVRSIRRQFANIPQFPSKCHHFPPSLALCFWKQRAGHVWTFDFAVIKSHFVSFLPNQNHRGEVDDDDIGGKNDK